MSTVFRIIISLIIMWSMGAFADTHRQDLTTVYGRILAENERLTTLYQENTELVNKSDFKALLSDLKSFIADGNIRDNQDGQQLQDMEITLNTIELQGEDENSAYILNRLISIDITEGDLMGTIEEGQIISSVIIFNIATLVHRSAPEQRADLRKAHCLHLTNMALVRGLYPELEQLIEEEIVIIELGPGLAAPQA